MGGTRLKQENKPLYSDITELQNGFLLYISVVPPHKNRMFPAEAKTVLFDISVLVFFTPYC